MIHTLEIFPDDPRPKLGVKHREIQLVFKDAKTKGEYIKAEGVYTKDAFGAYLLAEHNDKKDAQRKLDLKRCNFARQNNYYPKSGNKFIWEFTPYDGGDEPKRYA